MTNVEFFPYRTAKAKNIFLSLNRLDVQDLEKSLAKEAKTYIDNHTCYRFLDRHQNTIIVWFSDFFANFGTEIEIKNW